MFVPITPTKLLEPLLSCELIIPEEVCAVPMILVEGLHILQCAVVQDGCYFQEHAPQRPDIGRVVSPLGIPI